MDLVAYLEEDMGPGDVTTQALGLAREGTARLVARERCVLAGLDVASQVFSLRGARLEQHMNDGSWMGAGVVAGSVRGPIEGILEAERVALNILSRMSGIATLTRQCMERLADACSAAVVAGTRKTTPGFRAYEKAAIVIGGGDPHRMGLWDEAMIKDNHAAAAGGLAAAVARVRAARPDLMLTAEAESLPDALAAAAAGADWIMIDNQDPTTGAAWAKAIWDEHPQLKVEASGGIRPEQVADYGWADRISLGALTMAPPVDFGLDWGEE